MLTIMKHRLNRYLARSRMLSSQTNTSVFYFAYGANMSEEYFKSKIPLYKKIGLAELKGYSFSFSLACEYVGKGFGGIRKNEGSSVFGILYEVSTESIVFLDWLEWLPFNFYTRTRVPVLCENKDYFAEVYVPVIDNKNLFPSTGYRNMIIKALKSSGAPKNYVESIEAIESRNEFILDHSFNLADPAKPRYLPAFFYKFSDRIREKICNYI